MAVNKAKFSINASPASDLGFVATSAQVLTIRLENSTDVSSVRFELYDITDPESPLASLNAPDLTFAGSVRSKTLNPASGTTTITMITDGTATHSWLLRAIAATDQGDHVFVRLIALKNGKPRKVVPAESTEFSARGWADAWDELVDYVISAAGVGGGYTTIKNASGASQTQRSNLKVVGGTLTDNGTDTVLTIAASAGGGSGFPFTFFASTADGDPSAGGVRLNNATPASATSLFIDDVEAANGTDVRDLIASLGNVIGAEVRLQSLSAPANWIIYRIGGYTSASGYGKLTGLTVVDSSATVTLSTTVGDTFISFDVGVPKDLGNQGLNNVRYTSFNGIFPITPTTGAVTIDATNGQRQKISLSGNVSVTLTTPPGPMSVEVAWIQDVTGGRTVTMVTTVTGDLPPISLVGNATTVTVLDWNGTAWTWAYSFVRNADVATGAAIDGSKIAAAFGGQVVSTTTGFVGIGTAYFGVGESPGSGTGAHRSMASVGDVRMPRGQSVWYVRSDNDSSNIAFLNLQSNVAGVTVWDFGDSATPSTGIVRVKGGNAGELRAGTNATLSWGIGTLSIFSGATNRLRIDATGLGLYTAAPVAQQTVTGSRTSGAALADLLTKLALTGIIVDGSTA